MENDFLFNWEVNFIQRENVILAVGIFEIASKLVGFIHQIKALLTKQVILTGVHEVPSELLSHDTYLGGFLRGRHISNHFCPEGNGKYNEQNNLHPCNREFNPGRSVALSPPIVSLFWFVDAKLPQDIQIVT